VASAAPRSPTSSGRTTWFTGGGAAALIAVALLWVQGVLNGHADEANGTIAVPVLSGAAFVTALDLPYLVPVGT
jgi:type VI protein secretion system component VasF